MCNTYTFIIDTCIMDTCIMETSAWVTRPEHPKGAKDEVKRPLPLPNQNGYNTGVRRANFKFCPSFAIFSHANAHSERYRTVPNV